MQIFEIINVVSANSLSGTHSFALSLPFSPTKLIFLVSWAYICMYIVQYLQFSSLVTQKYRPIAMCAAIFVGPILFIALYSVDIAKKHSQGNGSIFEILKNNIANIIKNRGFSDFVKQRDTSALTIFNSSGNELREIFGQNKIDNPAIKLTEQIIANALEDNASDILIDPNDDSNYIVRYRIDGILRHGYQIDVVVAKSVINCIKVISDMDIAEKRRPQDGSFSAKRTQGKVSFRVASAGVHRGEKLSIRVLGQNAGLFVVNNLGLTKKQRITLEKTVAKPSGMILLCGPTGSGKTTTLYGILNEIDPYTRNIITVEDPIEYVLSNVSQIEINTKVDITFAKSLRSILRQDPDVICIGEIRDEESAAIALRASQTGHLVLATMHCDSNASSLVRLLDLGVSPILLSSALNLTVSQRLLRCLCDNCKEPAELTQSQINEFHKKGINYSGFYQPKGCDQCYHTGYRGRTAIFDILVFTDELKANIKGSEALIVQLRKAGSKKGLSNLHKQGLKKVVAGITSFEELKRVLG